MIPFARQTDVERRAKRKNLFRAALAAKRLGRGAVCLPYPMRRAPYVGAVLTATPDHEGRRPTPLFVLKILQLMVREFNRLGQSQKAQIVD